MGLESSASSIKKFNKGDVVSRQGDTTKELYILLQGSLGVYKNYQLPGETQITVVSQGSFYGEMSLFLGKEQDATLVALSNVAVLVINRKNTSEFFANQPDMAYTIIEGICKKLDAANVILAKIARDEMTQVASKTSALFPKGHGSYLLGLNNANDDVLYDQKCTCPMCGHSFSQLTVISSRLRLESTDMSLRSTYKDIEPLHYEIISCPNCFFSVSSEQFSRIPNRLVNDINKKLGPYRLDLEIKTGIERDTFTVFASFYLAILCAPICFDNYQMVTAGLWQKLSRLYSDCDDQNMVLYTSKKALDDYLYAYEQFNISEKQFQQLCYIIGDIYSRLGEIDQARNYFYLTKTNRAGSNVMKGQADRRLEEIRELKNKK